MPVFHQQRLREGVQHALDGALPRRLLRLHLDQLAGEGQLLLRQAQRARQRRAHGQHARRDVGALAPQCLHLGARLPEGLGGLRQPRLELEAALAQRVAPGLGFQQVARGGVAALRERQRVAGLGVAHGPAGRVGQLALAQAPGALLLGFLQLLGQAFELAAALAGALLLQAAQPGLLVGGQALQAPGLLRQPVQRGAALGTGLLQQPAPQLLPVAVHPGRQRADHAALRRRLVERLRRLPCRPQRLDLAPRRHHRAVRLVELAGLHDLLPNQPVGADVGRVDGARGVRAGRLPDVPEAGQQIALGLQEAHQAAPL